MGIRSVIFKACPGSYLVSAFFFFKKKTEYEIGEAEPDDSGDVETEPGAGVLHVPAEDILEIGQAVIAAEPHVVAEERQPQRVGHRLGDDRQINAGDARAEGQPAEN